MCRRARPVKGMRVSEPMERQDTQTGKDFIGLNRIQHGSPDP